MHIYSCSTLITINLGNLGNLLRKGILNTIKSQYLPSYSNTSPQVSAKYRTCSICPKVVQISYLTLLLLRHLQANIPT